MDGWQTHGDNGEVVRVGKGRRDCFGQLKHATLLEALQGLKPVALQANAKIGRVALIDADNIGRLAILELLCQGLHNCPELAAHGVPPVQDNRLRRMRRGYRE